MTHPTGNKEAAQMRNAILNNVIFFISRAFQLNCYWFVVAGMFVSAVLVIAGTLVTCIVGLLLMTSLVAGLFVLIELTGGSAAAELVELD